ncbi:glycerophosphodiester phosphodiesterase [Luteococcus sp. Sow4_B9]|uniref:glycerophosphodiester phosphodiesterase n=1 Tax=Luteococcus sp. Sow4_B9 TaxID=3438792 RepID=UPI003F9DAE45
MACTHLSRRTLLTSALGLGAIAALPGCTPDRDGTVDPYSDAVVIAHRGGGRNWPEMTLFAYQNAARLPRLTAMEVSVHRTRDGVLVCHHDVDTSRVGDRRLVIAQSTWDELRQVRITPRETDDPDQPTQPITRFEELLEAWPEQMTMWAEPKALDAVDPLFQTLSRLPDLRVVWKRPINAPGFEEAKMQGWGTFGYVLDGEQQTGYLKDVAPSKWMDMVGVQASASDERVREVVGIAGTYGSRTVMWPLNTLDERDRALHLGCRGLMASNVRDLVAAPMPD